MIKEYQGCKSHSDCVNFGCVDCLSEIVKQQQTEETDNHEAHEEMGWGCSHSKSVVFDSVGE